MVLSWPGPVSRSSWAQAHGIHKPFCYVSRLSFPVIFLNDSASGYWSCFSYCEVDYNHLDSKKYGDHDYGIGLVHNNIHTHAYVY